MNTSISNSGKEITNPKEMNFISRLQSWMDSVQGQTYMNYAYSVGAAIVILGTLFKLTHLPGSNFFLFLGLGTEVLVFLLSSFDRPFKIKNEGDSNNLGKGSPSVDPEVMERLRSKNLDDTCNAVTSAYNSQLDIIQKQTAATEKMTAMSTELTHKMEELNNLYSRMINAAKGTE